MNVTERKVCSAASDRESISLDKEVSCSVCCIGTGGNRILPSGVKILQRFWRSPLSSLYFDVGGVSMEAL